MNPARTVRRWLSVHRWQPPPSPPDPCAGDCEGAGRSPVAGWPSFRRIVPIPFGAWMAALERWQLTGPGGELRLGHSVLRGPAEHDPHFGTCRIEAQLARGPLRPPTRMRLGIDHWSATATVLELIPCRRVQPTAAYFRAGRDLLEAVAHALPQPAGAQAWAARGRRRGRVLGYLAMVVPLGMLGAFALAGPAAASTQPRSFLTVMTRNMDDGTDFGYILAAAGDPAALGPAVVNTFCEVVASNVEQRAARIADEIAASQPDMVSLQEVARWQSFVPLPCTGPTVIDAESALLNELAADGVTYHVVGQLDEFSSSAIPGLPVSFLDRDVLLTRAEPAAQMTLSNLQAQHFSTLLTVPLAPGANVTILRGWLSADATVRGRTVRIIATHLESFFEPVQEAQAAEIANGPANTSLPVILAGDLNTGPGSTQTASYQFLTTAAGFTDTWTVTQPGIPGFTDGYYTEDPFTIVPGGPTERIDLVLVRNIALAGAPEDYLVGTETPHPSDHAGVVATVGFSA